MNGDKIMFEINGHTKQLGINNGIILLSIRFHLICTTSYPKPYITTMFTEHGA